MAFLYGLTYRLCPYCCEDILPGQSYEVATGESPIEGMTIHSTCARQREHARETFGELTNPADSVNKPGPN